MTTRRKDSDLTIRRAAPNARVNSARDEDRSVEFVMSTENPVRIFDMTRFEEVDEILLADGMILPPNNQVPLLDSHDRMSVDSVLGSIREIRIERGPDGNKVIGRAYFSRKQRAYDTYVDTRDGHITDLSVGYFPNESVWIPEGNTQRIGNRDFTGPVLVTTRWSLKEGSATPIGADPNAKSRAEVAPIKPEEKPGETTHAENDIGGKFRMNEKLKALLLQRGLAAGSTDEQALQFLNMFTKEEQDKIRSEAELVVAEPRTPQLPVIDIAAIQENAARAERARISEIESACRIAGLPEMADEFVRAGTSADNARKAIFSKMSEGRAPVATSPAVSVAEECDKVRAAMTDGILLRQFNGKIENPAAGAHEFRGVTISRMAEETLRRAGIPTERMSRAEIVDLALGLKQRAGYTIAQGNANFPEIVRDAANKTMQRMFDETPNVWSVLARAVDIPDFKTVYRPQLSESENLAAIAEKGEYTELRFSDRAETYSLATYGGRWTASRKLIVNDDLDGLMRIPRHMGAAAQRQIETLFIAVLTGNPNMSDGNALFDAAHSNVGSGAAFSATTVGSLVTLIRKAKGFGQSTAPLLVVPRYLLVPEALRWSAQLVCQSPGYPVATWNDSINPARQDGIIPLSSPFLDDSSALIHYMFADPNAYDTIEVGFLEGTGRRPELFETDQIDPDGRIYHVRLDTVAKALAWQTMARHAGA